MDGYRSSYCRSEAFESNRRDGFGLSIGVNCSVVCLENVAGGRADQEHEIQEVAISYILADIPE